ncbi:Fungal Zn(2)-Cys(6) binuclear cluster domain-containing protein 10 [Elsinoe fawcettii]|nr:Fungal Zn(2)-Cys(6) binuclear cluster domain-containing protein 10 [Elsinoe fawcettii]
MDDNHNLNQLTEAARPRKRQRGNGTSNSDIPLHPDLQQHASQPAHTTANMPQQQDYQQVMQQRPMQNDYPPDMRQQQQSDATDYPRRRAMIACEICRGRKTRCDGAKPKCRLCTELGAECVYREPGQKLDAGDKLILEHLQRIEGLLQNTHHGSHTNGHSARAYPPDGLSDSPPIDPTMHRYTITAGRQDGTGVPDDQSYQSGKPGTSTLFVELTQNPSFRQLIQTPLSTLAGLASESKRPKLSFLDRSDLDLNDITSHVDAYFQILHPYHAIINPETWQAVYATASLNGFAKGLETSTVLLIAALGWAAVTGNKLYAAKLEDTLGYQLFAQAWNSLPEMAASTGASAVQCLFFGSAFLLAVFRPLESWYTLNLAASKLQTELSLRDELAPAELETLKRLYWNVEQLRTDVASALHLQPSTEGISHQTVGLPSGYSRDIELGMENGLSFLSPLIGLQRLSQRVQNSRIRPAVVVDGLLPLAQGYNQQLNLWYEHLPDSTRFQQDAPTTSIVQSELRHGFFACRAQILRPVVLEVMQDESLLLDHVTREYCKQSLEASVRQIENPALLYTGHLRCSWKHANDMAAETLFVMGATLSPGLAALLPPAEDMNRTIAHVITTLEEVATISPSLGVKVAVLRSADSERKQFVARQQ